MDLSSDFAASGMTARFERSIGEKTLAPSVCVCVEARVWQRHGVSRTRTRKAGGARAKLQLVHPTHSIPPMQFVDRPSYCYLVAPLLLKCDISAGPTNPSGMVILLSMHCGELESSGGSLKQSWQPWAAFKLRSSNVAIILIVPVRRH